MNSLWRSFSFVRVSISSTSSLVSISDTASQSSQLFSTMPAWIHIHSTSPNQLMKWCSSTKSLSTFVTLPILHPTCFSTDFLRSKRRIIKEVFICASFFWYFFSALIVSNDARNKKKERKRNFVPANVGIIAMFILFFNTMIQFLLVYQVGRIRFVKIFICF